MTFIYTLELGDGTACRFDIDTERGNSPEPAGKAHAPWTRLENSRCNICSLADAAYCPVAVDLEEVLERFSKVLSCERVKLSVVTAGRTYQTECDAQTALVSLYGLIMATSRCPVLSRMRPLAYSHIPFFSLDETLMRVVGAYLTKQYFIRKDHDGSPDWDLTGLIALYDDLSRVNMGLAARLRSASESDASINAISNFHSMSTIFSISLGEELARKRSLFVDGF